MHIHTLVREPMSSVVTCEGCDVGLRLATYDEAVFVGMMGIDSFNGEVLYFTNGAVVVPANFSLFQEA